MELLDSTTSGFVMLVLAGSNVAVSIYLSLEVKVEITMMGEDMPLNLESCCFHFFGEKLCWDLGRL